MTRYGQVFKRWRSVPDWSVQRLGLDPALVSAPRITTLVDATGLAIYLLIARTLLEL